MFEITGSHIAQLNDTDLRTLVARLCEAELRNIGLPVSAVTAGGDQNAADGGLDVRVDLPPSTPIRGFVPRPATGFQVKVPDMPPNEIMGEMCPNGTVRPVIVQLAAQSGAYIIVSASGSTADAALRRRQSAMRNAVSSLPNAEALALDFYDRDRLTLWVRQHSGMVAWVRVKIGQPIQGWGPFANWASPNEGLEAEYLLDGTNRLHDWHSQQQGPLTVLDGIQRMRAVLADAKGVVRLVGLSGTGKTRLVQALFDPRVGGENEALDPTLALYTDLAEHPEPSPRDLMRQLVQNRRRAILVIDNCPPDTHRALTAICAEQESALSLITIEYDVGEDEPEDTKVFRLEPASDEIIGHLLERRAPHISQVDGRRIAEFSGGNARIAFALARTVERGDSVSNLADRALFERLFHQRNVNDDSLMRAAEVCSLVYSFDGEVMEGERAELPILADLAGMSVDQLYRYVAVLRSRDLVQRRGQWQAVLPHAVANRLARQALDRIAPERVVTMFLTQERLLQSFSRRLGYLHDSEPARMIAQGWLASGGLLSEVEQLSSVGMAMFQNVAPVVPNAALNAIEHAANGPKRDDLFTVDNSKRDTCINLLRSLAYDAALFPRAAALLSCFAMAEHQERNNHSAHNAFKQLFFIRLSGTHASLEQRLHVINLLISSEDTAGQVLGLVALGALLESWHFMGHGFEFGARTRDYGWWPNSRDAVVNWYSTAITYAQRLALSGSPLAQKVRVMLAENFRSLWSNAGMVDQLEAAASAVVEQDFWPEGWIAVKQTMRFDIERLPAEIEPRLLALERRLRPDGLLEKIRAFLFSETYGYLDMVDAESTEAEDDDTSTYLRMEKTVNALGREVANYDEIFEVLLPDLVSLEVNSGAFSFGKGLAAGARDPTMTWQRLVNAFATAPESKRSPDVLRGYLRGSVEQDAAMTAGLLDDAVDDPILGPWFPILQTAIEIGEIGAWRLETALRLLLAPPWAFRSLIYGRVVDSIPTNRLQHIILGIAALPGGYEVAVDVLAARLHSAQISEEIVGDELVLCGRELLQRWSMEERDHHLDYNLGQIVDFCLVDPEATVDATMICRRLAEALNSHEISTYDNPHLLSRIFHNQPFIALDEFFGELAARDELISTWRRRLIHGNPVDVVPEDTLLTWAQVAPPSRYEILALVITPFTDNEDDNKLSELMWRPTALALFRLAPNRVAVLENLLSPLVPISWSGSRANILEQRRKLLRTTMSDTDPAVVTWVRQQDSELEQLIQRERLREQQRDESFE